MSHKDKDTKLAYQRKWYQKNKEKQKQWVSEYKKHIWKWFANYKAQLSCSRCNENESCCLDFHHTDPKHKEYTVAQMVRNTCSIEKILREIEKCEVVCANCHRKIHAGVV